MFLKNFNKIILFVIQMILQILLILMAVMFITLLERKVLGYTQTRKGPNKNSILGLIQPILDGVKLLVKEFLQIIFSNKIFFLFGPSWLLIGSILSWQVISLSNPYENIFFLMLFLLVNLGTGIYSSLMSGWSSNSKYSMLGAVRSMAQTISYEISLSMMIFCILIPTKSFCFIKIFNMESSFSMLLLDFSLFFVLFVTILAETNRAPFDFSEGESELVSGFNIEFSSSFFALMSISEYGNILSLSMLLFILFFNKIFIFLLLMIMSVLFIRSVFPRFRYDKLMFFAWFKLLPFLTFTLFSSFFISFS